MTLAQQASRASWASWKKPFFHQSNRIPDIKFFDNLIGWMVANARDATLARASYCEPGFKCQTKIVIKFIGKSSCAKQYYACSKMPKTILLLTVNYSKYRNKYLHKLDSRSDGHVWFENPRAVTSTASECSEDAMLMAYPLSVCSVPCYKCTLPVLALTMSDYQK